VRVIKLLAVRAALQQVFDAGASLQEDVQHHGGTTTATVTDKDGNPIGLISR
jgi:hypothetical protein